MAGLPSGLEELAFFLGPARVRLRSIGPPVEANTRTSLFSACEEGENLTAPFPETCRAWKSWPAAGILEAVRRPLLLIACLYLLSSLVYGPLEGTLKWRLPGVLSGDPPHYLTAIHSLIEDGDWDLSNNYRQGEEGDWDVGRRFRGRPIDHHADLDLQGREITTHSPFFPLILAAVVWPLTGTPWVEPACIVLTLLISLLGLAWFWRERQEKAGLLLLALATPLWCYSRDLWTEPWVLTLWVGLLRVRRPVPAALLGFAGTLIKYPFAVVPLTLGLVAGFRGERCRGLWLAGSALAGLAVVILTVQYLFRDAPHFSLFHSGLHLGFDWPLDGIVGLLLGPENGLLCFFPFLAWGLAGLAKEEAEKWAPALLFLLVHAPYQDWGGGTGFSARYLVPALPLLVAGIGKGAFRRRGFRIAVAWSLFWGALGGFFPPLVYDRSLPQIFWRVLEGVTD